MFALNQQVYSNQFFTDLELINHLCCVSYNHGKNISEKLYFSYEIAHYGKSSTSSFKEPFASIDKIFFLGGRLGTRL